MLFPKKRIFFYAAVFFEVILIFVLLVNISYNYFAKKGTLISITPLSKEYLQFEQIDGLNYFYQPKPNIIKIDDRRWFQKPTVYSFNSEGFNDKREFTINKPSTIYRIITLGDSFTFGLYVDPQKNYSSQLERLLNRDPFCSSKNYEIINLGVPGYDIEYSIERFKLAGYKYNPDLVIWLLKEDDFSQINELITNRSVEIKNQMKKTGELAEFEKKGKYFIPQYRAVNELENKLGWDGILNVQREALEKMQKYYSGKLVILSFPSNNSRFDAFIKNYIKNKANLYYFDTLSDLLNSEVLSDGHPNEDGHTKIAQNIFQYLTNNSQYFCQ